MTFEEYLKELARIAAEETGRPESDFSINPDAAREYFDSGIPAYFCFREEFSM